MSTESTIALVALVVSVLGSFLVWLIGDARSKTKQAYIESELAGQAKLVEELTKTNASRIGGLEVGVAYLKQEASELRRMIETKASREAVDAFKGEFMTLRTDMDRRFDKLERLLEQRHP